MTLRWYCLLCVLVLCAPAVYGAQNTRFADDIKRYYCSADWICKSFERMSSKEFTQSWHQMVGLIADARFRWFYMYDTPTQYQQKSNQRRALLRRLKFLYSRRKLSCSENPA